MWTNFDLTLISLVSSLWSHIDLTLSSLGSHSDLTLISLWPHFDLILIIHLDLTLRVHFREKAKRTHTHTHTHTHAEGKREDPSGAKGESPDPKFWPGSHLTTSCARTHARHETIFRLVSPSQPPMVSRWCWFGCIMTAIWLHYCL